MVSAANVDRAIVVSRFIVKMWFISVSLSMVSSSVDSLSDSFSRRLSFPSRSLCEDEDESSNVGGPLDESLVFVVWASLCVAKLSEVKTAITVGMLLFAVDELSVVSGVAGSS